MSKHEEIKKTLGGNPGQIIVSPSEQAVAIKADGTKFMKLKAKIEKALTDMATGKENPTLLRRKLERTYMRMMQEAAFPDRPKIAGAKAIKIIYPRLGENVELYWDWIPSTAGPMVIGLCPECFVNAPSQVDWRQQTQPTFIESRMAWVRGNPEADAKAVTFRIASPTFTMWLTPQNRLTVREIIRCPSGRHGPEAQVIRRCDWAVRVEDSIATRVSRNTIFKPGQKRPITGPLIIVK